MNWWIPKTRGQILTGLCAVALLVTNSFGGLKAQRIITETVDGVDDLGNASSVLGFDGPGKSYKDINRGIIVQINKSFVTNAYLLPKLFRNRGLPILDPQTNETVTTTSDLLIVANKSTYRLSGTKPPLKVTKVGRSLWLGTQIKVYDPRYPVLPVPTTP